MRSNLQAGYTNYSERKRAREMLNIECFSAFSKTLITIKTTTAAVGKPHKSLSQSQSQSLYRYLLPFGDRPSAIVLERSRRRGCSVEAIPSAAYESFILILITLLSRNVPRIRGRRRVKAERRERERKRGGE